ncbi:hypothetical protein LRAMOSA01149 [Lichtheimia ramosa]|uniref:Ricin B lectin domain-containing protein n=1 Tax=Lichtheimia ramosa TaxID=688394 RepID=A0A077WC24_9FUNG|nr:hypothetical protein LRAMOSA01149 [Lichtheimia ramosa]
MSGFPVDTYFTIKSQKNSSLLAVKAGSTDSAANVVIAAQNDDDIDSQLWTYDDGFLTNKKSGLVLDVAGGDLKSEANVIQYERKMTMTLNQRFGHRDGFIYARADPRLVLDIKGAEDKDNTSVILYKRKTDIDNANQQWQVEPYEG